MRVVDAICRLGKQTTTLDSTIGASPHDIDGAIVKFASIGDRAAFDVLPPVLLYPSPKISHQKLWSSINGSGSAAYTPGPPRPVAKDDKVLGGAIFDFDESSSCPALLYSNGDLITMRVYNSPLSTLESKLYEERQSASPLEVAWKGVELASVHLELIAAMGSHMLSFGLRSVPTYLLSASGDAYHLVRPGPIPFLYLRTATTDAEQKSVENLIHAALLIDDDENATVESNKWFESVNSQLENVHTGSQTRFSTVFSREKHPGSAQVSKDDDEARRALVKEVAALPCTVTVTGLLLRCTEFSEQFSTLVSELEVEIREKELETAPLVSRAGSNTKTLAYLCSICSRVCNVRRLGSVGISDGFLLSSAIFKSEDAGLAARQLSAAVDNASAENCTIGLLHNLSRRVDSNAAVMCVELGPGRTIKSIRLINCDVDFKLDVQNAGRVLAAPWIQVVCHLNSLQKSAEVFLVETNGIHRDLLTVCNSVRKTFGIDAQKHVKQTAPPPPPPPAPPPPAPPPAVKVDLGPIQERLLAIEETIKKAPPAPLPPLPPPTPSPPPPPPPGGLSYSSPELKRLQLATKKWARVGKRPRASS